MKKGSQKVLIAPSEISGFGSSLSEGFMHNGWESHVFLKTPHSYQYETPQSHNWIILFLNKHIAQVTVARDNGKRFSKKYLRFVKKWASFVVFIWVLINVKYVVFIAGRSLFKSHIDLPIFKFFKKKVVMVYLGSDSRPQYLSGSWLLDHDRQINDELVERTKKAVEEKADEISYVEKNVTYVVDNPLAGHLHQKPFVNWFYMGFPIKFNRDQIRDGADSMERGVVIVHAPSNTGIKGSDKIVEVVSELISEGYPIEYKQLVNVPNEEVLRFLKEADLLIDQLWGDTPLAGVACEAASAGCCVIVSGEDWSYFENNNKSLSLPPSVLTTPDSLKSSIVKCINDRDLMVKKSQELKDFASEVWSSEAVALRYINLFHGVMPDKAWVSTSECVYYGGNGAPIKYFTALRKRMGI